MCLCALDVRPLGSEHYPECTFPTLSRHGLGFHRNQWWCTSSKNDSALLGIISNVHLIFFLLNKIRFKWMFQKCCGVNVSDVASVADWMWLVTSTSEIEVLSWRRNWHWFASHFSEIGGVCTLVIFFQCPGKHIRQQGSLFLIDHWFLMGLRLQVAF